MLGKELIDFIINNNLQNTEVFTAAEGYINRAERIKLEEGIILISSNCYIDNEYLKEVIKEM